MFSTQIRPVTDLRNKYAEIESDLARGPVVLTKNGYGSSVLVSISLYDKLIQRNEIYESISRSEAEISFQKTIRSSTSTTTSPTLTRWR